MMLNRTLFVLSILTPCVYAANPSTSSISVIVPAIVQISNLSDITLTPTNFTSAATGNTSICIYTNTISPLGSYYVTASSTNASAGIFRASTGSAFISYSAFWNNTSAASQTVSLTSGTKTAQQTGGNGTSLTCSGGANANFNISLSSAQVTGASPGSYTDTVTLLISPS